MVLFVFTKQAEKSFTQLPQVIQQRILKKLKELKRHSDILSVLKPLHNFAPATHRLRVGDYRLILSWQKQRNEQFEFLVLDVGHRREIYQ